MHLPQDEQQPDALLEPDEQQEPVAAPEPRLLTRPERSQERPKAPVRHKQREPERGLASWAQRLQAQRRGSAPRRIPAGKAPATRTSKPGQRSRGRLWLGVAASLVGLFAVGLLVGTLYLRHAAMAALPTLDGTEHVTGLHAPVQVARNAQGVPTLTASSLPDLLFAQGYVTASDRLWQMDALRRHAGGELAEVLGPSMVEHDRRQRYLQLRAAADRGVAQLPADQLQQLEAYAEGVNAFITSHADALPLEFKLLAYRPAAWTPRDSLLVSMAMWQDLATEFPRKLDREGLQAHLPAALVMDLYPVGSWRDQPPVAQGRDITAPHNVEQIPLDPSQSQLGAPQGGGATPASLVAMTSALAGGDRCDGCRSGSNNWVVSGARTASGAPLVSNDMHLTLGIPDLWYEASLHAPVASEETGAASQLDVTGFTLPGVPFAVVGRNREVAWGVTNLGADVQDLRVEHLRGTGDTAQFEREDGSWAPVGHHAETIHVRGGRVVALDVQTTTHANGAGTMETPIVSPLYPGETRALSLAWTAYDPAAVRSPFGRIDLAQNGQELVEAFRSFAGPSLNVVWADRGGHIGYHAVGWVPVRGPAVQHPRAVQTPATPDGAAPPDEGSEGAEEPEAALVGRPQFVLSAFRPQRRRVADGPTRPPRSRAARPERMAAKPGRVAPKVRTKAAAQAQLKVKPEEEVIPEPATVSYTLGSPVSPLPVDALDASQAWSGYVPYEAMPAVVDPRNGFLATANSRVTADDSPYALTNDWADPFRTERLVHLLAGRRGLTPAAMLHMETDVYSDVNKAMAQRLAYAVDHADPGQLHGDVARLHTAADLLRNWDGEMKTDSAPAMILSATTKALWPALLVPQIMAHDGIHAKTALPYVELYTWGEKTTALELLLQHEPARWLPPGNRTWNDFLAMTLAQALDGAHAPGNLAHWQYGEEHRVTIAHPIFGTHPWLSRLLGVRATTGARPAPGDGTTLDQIGAHFGPSERFTADLSSTDAAIGNITTGESANPRSPWYLDQFEAWLGGTSFDLPSAGSAAAHTLTLAP